MRQQEQQEYDDGEESDPEDSETPWVCVLRITRRKPRPPRTSAESQRPGDTGAKKDKDGKERLKVRLATLSPTPHHPKVVAMLKVSWPLKAIDLLELIELDRELLPVVALDGVVVVFTDLLPQLMIPNDHGHLRT